jgi:hypothetical protein
LPVLLAVVASAAALTACTLSDARPTQQTDADASSSDAVPAEVLAGLTVEVSQSRSDWADRVVDVDVTDEGTTSLEVVEATLTAPAFTGQAVSERGRTVRPGTTRSLSVALGAPVCAAEPSTVPEPVDATVSLLVADDQGRRSEVVLPATDPRGHLTRIHGEDCAAAAVAQGAELSLDDVLDVREVDGRLLGALTLRTRPVDGGPVVRVEQVDGTVLLAPEGGEAWVAGGLDDEDDGSADRTETLTFTPARCDAHAVAEDKRGTFLGVHATVDGVPVPVFYLPVTTQVRGEIHDFVGRACGWA